VKRIDFISLFLIGYGVFYGIFLLLINANNENEYASKLCFYFNIYGWIYLGVSIIYVLLTFWSSYFFHKSPNSEDIAWNKILDKQNYILFLIIGWVTLLVSMLLYWLYSIALGGFVSIIINAMAIRNGVFDLISNKWSFLAKFGGLAFFSSFIFLGISIAKPQTIPKSLKVLTIIGLILSIVYSLFVILSWWSRSHFIFYVITLLLAPFVRKSKFILNKKSIIYLILSSIILIILFLGITYKIKGVKMGEGESDRFSLDASVRLLPTFVLIEDPKIRYFQDLFLFPVYILPQKIWKGRIINNTASDELTIKMTGGKKGNLGVPGSMVIGIIPFALLEGGIIGIVIFSIFFAFLLIRIENWILCYLPPGISETLLIYIIFRFVLTSLWNVDPQVIVYNNIDIVSGIVIFFIMKKIFIHIIKRNKFLI
jgi:hypothetical protein